MYQISGTKEDKMTYDIAVIGSGSVGSFAGYYAAKMGLKTCLIDKFQAPHTQGSYHGDTRIFRIAYGEGEKYIPLLQEAYTLWGEFEKEQNIKLFERCGLLNIGSNSTFMQNVLSSVKNYDLKAKILNAKELQENYNICVSDDFFGVLETDTGFVYSDLSVKSAINAACKLGAHTLCDEIVRICKENGVYKIQTQNSSIQVKQILISAGSYVNEVLSVCEFDLPKVPVGIRRKVVNWFETDSYKLSQDFPAFILEFEDDYFYGFPDFADGLKVGRDRVGEIISTREERVEFGSYEQDTLDIGKHIKEFFPDLKDFSKGSVCTYPLSPDDDFIIDFLDENLFFMGGLSHGFKFAPTLGLLGVKALQTQKLDLSIEQYFSLKRFK